MSFLSLARGDQSARVLLQRAIKARYGPRPVVVDSIRLSLSAQAKGPLGLPLNISVSAAFVDVTHWRWVLTRKLIVLNRGSIVESYDGGAVYTGSLKATTRTSEPLILTSMRRRLWVSRAALLTPLTQEGVTLKFVDNRTFQAHTEDAPNDVATIRLNEDDTVAAVEAQRYNPATQQTQLFALKPSREIQTINDFVVPKLVTYHWGDAPAETYQIVGVEPNAKIPLTEFSLT